MQSSVSINFRHMYTRRAFYVFISVFASVALLASANQLQDAQKGSSRMSPKELLYAVSAVEAEAEDDGASIVQSWGRLSDASAIPELIDAVYTLRQHGSAVGLIIRSLKVKEADKIRLLSEQVTPEAHPIKKVVAMSQLQSYDRNAPAVLKAWVSALNDMRKYNQSTPEGIADMRVCDAAFNMIIGNLEVRNLIVHHSLSWTYEMGDGMDVNLKDQRVSDLKQFLLSKGLATEIEINAPSQPALEVNPKSSELSPAQQAATAPKSAAKQAEPPTSAVAPAAAKAAWLWLIAIVLLFAIAALIYHSRSQS